LRLRSRSSSPRLPLLLPLLIACVRAVTRAVPALRCPLPFVAGSFGYFAVDAVRFARCYRHADLPLRLRVLRVVVALTLFAAALYLFVALFFAAVVVAFLHALPHIFVPARTDCCSRVDCTRVNSRNALRSFTVVIIRVRCWNVAQLPFLFARLPGYCCLRCVNAVVVPLRWWSA